MKWFFILLLITVNCFGQMVPAELEFEEIPGAKNYHLELKSLSSGKIHKVHRGNWFFKFNIRPGKYEVRTRVSDVRGVFSLWSEVQTFEVPPLAPIEFTKHPVEVQIPKGQISQNIQIKWSTGVGANKYKIKIKNELGELSEYFTDKPFYETAFPPGVYSFSITSLTADDVASLSTLESTTPLAVIAADLDPPKTQDLVKLKTGQLKMKSSAPIHFELSEIKFLSTTPELIYQGVVTDGLLLLDEPLPPGLYQMVLWTSQKGFRDSTKLVKDFVIKPEEADLKK
jgi:hypothetical protein